MNHICINIIIKNQICLLYFFFIKVSVVLTVFTSNISQKIYLGKLVFWQVKHNFSVLAPTFFNVFVKVSDHDFENIKQKKKTVFNALSLSQPFLFGSPKMYWLRLPQKKYSNYSQGMVLQKQCSQGCSINTVINE